MSRTSRINCGEKTFFFNSSTVVSNIVEKIASLITNRYVYLHPNSFINQNPVCMKRQLQKSILGLSLTLVSLNYSNAQSISTGDYNSLLLCNTNTAMATGRNQFGELCDSTTTQRISPVAVTQLSGLVAVYAGGSHSLFLKSDGTVWSSGYNGSGQLGNGSTGAIQSIPSQVLGLTGIKAIMAGEIHSLFLKSDGTVWACGDNGDGQLGDGTTTSKSTAFQISGLSGIVAIGAGEGHSLFVKNDGTVWACGRNTFGQLGDGTNTKQKTPVQVTSLSGIVAASGGQDHSLFLKSDGTVWTSGHNNYGQLCDGTTGDENTPVQASGLTGITAVSARAVHSLFLKNDGTVWGCGWNFYGELGNGTSTYLPVKTAVQASGLTNVIAISIGLDQSLFLKSDGTVWACGHNNYGQLGDGTTTDRNSAVKLTGSCTLALGIKENASSNSISVYPNPASDQFSIELAGSNNATAEIFNMEGQLLQRVFLVSPKTNLLISDLASGLYILRVKRVDDVLIQKFIKE